MKRFSKETTVPGRTASSTKTIVVRRKDLIMYNHKNTARYSNTKAANFQKLKTRFNTITKRVKVEFIRLAIWLSVATVIL